MVELTLEGWTAAQREGLGFLVDDAGISAEWGPSSISVPDESQARVQRFINFLADHPGDATSAIPATTRPYDADWDSDEPRLLFADDLGIADVASPGLRLGGALIDGLVYTAFLVCSFVIVGRAPGIQWLQIAFIAGYQIGMVGLLGHTLGNMAVRTRVVKVGDRSIPGLRAGVIRWLVPEAGVLIVAVLSWPDALNLLWYLIVYGPILSGPSHRGLHDRAAGVMVLDDRLTAPRRAVPDDRAENPW